MNSLTGSRLTVWPHRNTSTKSAWSDLNRRSRAPATTALRGGARRISQAFPHAEIRSHATRKRTQKHPAGVEPALPPWQGGRLPLHHGRVVVCRIVKEQSTGRESNPRFRITSAESSPLNDQCLTQWDQMDLNHHLLG